VAGSGDVGPTGFRCVGVFSVVARPGPVFESWAGTTNSDRRFLKNSEKFGEIQLRRGWRNSQIFKPEFQPVLPNYWPNSPISHRFLLINWSVIPG
jgi:hypothetical protein